MFVQCCYHVHRSPNLLSAFLFPDLFFMCSLVARILLWHCVNTPSSTQSIYNALFGNAIITSSAACVIASSFFFFFLAGPITPLWTPGQFISISLVINQSIVYYARRQQNKNSYKIYSESYKKISTHT